MDHPLPWLRYVDADDLDDQTVDFDGLKVRNDAGEKLGEVDGFIVDSDSGRPYYVVVENDGWFKSKHFLLPVGHARMDADNDALVADLPRERIDRFPGFDKDNFEKLSEGDLRRINDEICAACGTSDTSYSTTEPYSSAWDRPDYKQPDWWKSEPSLRMGDNAFAAPVDYPATKTAPMADPDIVSRGRYTEQVSASETTSAIRTERDDRTSRDVDPSPFPEGRAQPGDVIGLDTGGERTHVGETAEDENKRRRDAEEAAQKQRGS